MQIPLMQLAVAQSSMSISHAVPVNPVKHSQVKNPTSSTQIPLLQLTEGSSHWLMVISQLIPVKSGVHSQVYDVEFTLVQVAPFKHISSAQGSNKTSHSCPVYAGGQSQKKEFPLIEQLPSF
jgi:hypothetical protein